MSDTLLIVPRVHCVRVRMNLYRINLLCMKQGRVSSSRVSTTNTTHILDILVNLSKYVYQKLRISSCLNYFILVRIFLGSFTVFISIELEVLLLCYQFQLAISNRLTYALHNQWKPCIQLQRFFPRTSNLHSLSVVWQISFKHVGRNCFLKRLVQFCN